MKFFFRRKEPPTEGPVFSITIEMVGNNVQKMNPGPSAIIREMIKTAGKIMIDEMIALFNYTRQNGVVPEDWYSSFIMDQLQGKVEALLRESYRDLKQNE